MRSYLATSEGPKAERDVVWIVVGRAHPFRQMTTMIKIMLPSHIDLRKKFFSRSLTPAREFSIAIQSNAGTLNDEDSEFLSVHYPKNDSLTDNWFSRFF